MSNRPTPIRLLAAALLAAVAVTGCQRGQGSNDTLADGAVDRPGGNSGATNVGPSASQVDSAGPGDNGSAVSGAAGTPTLVLVPQGPKGAYVANGAGVTVYALVGDRDGSKCTGDCLRAWPPVLANMQQPNGGAGLQGALITTVTRPDGSRQVAYDGHPLYQYAAEAGAGKTGGDGVKDAYGTWMLVTTDAAAVPAAGPPPATSTGG